MNDQNFITLLDEGEFMSVAAGRDEVKAEVLTRGAVSVVQVTFGDHSALMNLETAEAIATALRFHQMCEWGDTVDSK